MSFLNFKIQSQKQFWKEKLDHDNFCISVGKDVHINIDLWKPHIAYDD